MKRIIYIVLGLGLIASSCQDTLFSLQDSSEIVQLVFNLDEFSFDSNTPTTKLGSTVDANGISYYWNENDTIGIFPQKGNQISFPVLYGAGSSQAKFTGGGWGLKPNTKYFSYYPLQGDLSLNIQKIPVSYLGQLQYGNNSHSHLGQFAYMSASGSTPSDGMIDFSFSNRSALLRFDLPVKSGTYNLLTIETEEQGDKPFITRGTYNLTSSNPVIEGIEFSERIDLALDNCVVNETSKLIAYLMIAPVDLTGKKLLVTAYDNKGHADTFIYEGHLYKAGGAYSHSKALIVPKRNYYVDNNKQSLVLSIESLASSGWASWSINESWIHNVATDDQQTILLSIDANESTMARKGSVVIDNGLSSVVVWIHQGYSDLSKKERANCYIVNSTGTYMFDARLKGNSDLYLGNMETAELLWETTNTISPISSGVIIDKNSVSLDKENGLVCFSTHSPITEGNAVIAVRGLEDNDGDGKGDILWSWHIWVCKDFEPNNGIRHNDNGLYMDRNLGALSAKPTERAKTIGLIYQFGRKDPFIGIGDFIISESSLANPLPYYYSMYYSMEGVTRYVYFDIATATSEFPNPVMTSEEVGTIDYVVSHPTTYLLATDATNGDWLYYKDGTYDSYNDYYHSNLNTWENTDGSKSMFDPCPPGWRVPKTDFAINQSFPSRMNDISQNGVSVDYQNWGLLLSPPLADTDSWFPIIGVRRALTGELILGAFNYENENNSGLLRFLFQNGTSWGHTYITPFIYGHSSGHSSYLGGKASAISVRCVKNF